MVSVPPSIVSVPSLALFSIVAQPPVSPSSRTSALKLKHVLPAAMLTLSALSESNLMSAPPVTAT